MKADCAALVATKDRWGLLCERALPSIARQTLAPAAVILVNDGALFPQDWMSVLEEVLAPLPCVVLGNDGMPGVAGAWNSGLRYLRHVGFQGYVAILDDDDEWDACHLVANMAEAERNGADLVVSGLRRVVAGQVQPRPLPDRLSLGDFLRGNPGMQGSNTFVSLQALQRAGDFTDGLPSLNDRDLAIRLLELPDLRVAYTRRWTASWHHGAEERCLSQPRSNAKIQGLRMFWRLHGGRMTLVDEQAFLERAWRLFGVTPSEVVDALENV